MVRDIRIKEYRWERDYAAATTETVYTDNVLNGTIVEVDFGFNRAGSIALSVSGTGETFFETNAVSGTSVQVVRPVAYNVDSAGAVVAGSQVQNYVVNDNVALVVTGAASGTNPLTVNLRYI